MTNTLTDEDLVAHAVNARNHVRRQEYEGQLFQRHQKRVALWCIRITGERQSAADLAQEVFMRAFQNLESFQKQARFTTWLYTIARNHCLNYLKSSARRLSEIGAEAALEVEDHSSREVFARIDEEGRQAQLLRLVGETLSEPEMKVMTLHYGEGVPLATITRLLQLRNRSGAKAYIVSARRKLDSAFRRWEARRSRLSGQARPC